MENKIKIFIIKLIFFVNLTFSKQIIIYDNSSFFYHFIQGGISVQEYRRLIKKKKAAYDESEIVRKITDAGPILCSLFRRSLAERLE